MTLARGRIALALTIALAASNGPAWSAGKLGAEMFKEYGGTWRADCMSSTSPAVIIRESAVEVMKGDKRISASVLPPEEWIDYFGRMPPENYQVAVQCTDAKGHSLDLIIYRDERGPYLTIEAQPDIEAAIGKSTSALQYRLCDAASRPVPEVQAAAPAEPATTPPGEMPDANVMVRDPAFRAAYHKALGKYAKVPWLANMDGRSGTTMRITVAGKEYIQVSCCKEHDCGASNTTVLYSPARRVVFGKVSLEGKTAMIGSPPPEVAKAVGERWRWQWVHDR